jgi:hypothetical protein
VHKESKNGVEDYLVYARRRSDGAGDRGLASPAKQTSIPRSGSFTKVCTVLSEGWMGLGRGLLAGLRWQGERAAADTPCTGKRRWV